MHVFVTSAGVIIRAGCFTGSPAEFSESVAKTHGDNEHGRAYRAAIDFIAVMSATEESEAE
jgi:hypothetical protein